MTPTQFDIEAEKILQNLSDNGRYFNVTEAKAQLHNLLVRSRIDEYKNHMPCTKYPNHYQVDKHHLEKRIATLEAQLKRNGGKT